MTSWLYMVTPSFARPCALSKICFVILVTLMVTLEGVEGVEDTSLGCRGCGLGVGSGGGGGSNLWRYFFFWFDALSKSGS